MQASSAAIWAFTFCPWRCTLRRARWATRALRVACTSGGLPRDAEAAAFLCSVHSTSALAAQPGLRRQPPTSAAPLLGRPPPPAAHFQSGRHAPPVGNPLLLGPAGEGCCTGSLPVWWLLTAAGPPDRPRRLTGRKPAMRVCCVAAAEPAPSAAWHRPPPGCSRSCRPAQTCAAGGGRRSRRGLARRCRCPGRPHRCQRA